MLVAFYILLIEPRNSMPFVFAEFDACVQDPSKSGKVIWLLITKDRLLFGFLSSVSAREATQQYQVFGV